MTPERWRQVRSIFDQAVECELASRAGLIRQRCGDDEELKKEVESLLASDRETGSLLDNPLNPVAARSADPMMAINPAAVLPERYEILGELGRGGMGIVYKARDRETGEVLALKILKPEIAADLQILERFKNELRLAHKITHRNVARLYEFHRAGDTVYLSMEYVEGESLRALLRRTGKLDVARGMDIARQLAAGLAEAHRHSIAHRDLKPENIMLTAGGEVKVLDFGISRSYAANVTATGAIIGTPAYMAPEQAEGKLADHRADIYAFGLILYEVFTGTAAFHGDTPVALALKQIRERPQPPREIAPELPAHIEQAILLCLEKDPASRFQSVEDLLRALEGEPLPKARKLVKSALRPWLFGAVAVVLLAAGVLYQVWKPAGLFRTSSPPAQPTHTQITFVGDAAFPAISPDGQSVAYVTGKKGQGQRLIFQDLKGGQAIELSKASSLAYPRWSPDGSELTVYSFDYTLERRRGVFLIPRLGGSSRFIGRGGPSCWSPDGSHIAVAGQPGFRIVDKVTGSVKSIPLSGFQWFMDLDWSPASNFIAVLGQLENGKSAIWTVHPDGTQQRKVIEEEALASPRWSATGDGIYFLRTTKGNTQELLKLSINPRSGEANPPASILWSGLQVGSYFTVSTNGTRLAYSRSQDFSNLWLAEFQGPGKSKEMQTRALTRGTSSYGSLSMSPDGKWIAFATGPHIYKIPIEGGTPIQLTFSDATHVSSSAWSPDGKRIAFGSNEGGTYRVWIVDADGANRRQFAKTQFSGDDPPQMTWSPGHHILYHKQGNQNFNILDPDTGEEKPLVQDESVGFIFGAKYSPDGKKVAVNWNRRQPGLWVISLMDKSATPLGSSGDLWPAGWSPDGRLIYAFRYPSSNSILSIPAGGGNPANVLTLPGDIAEAIVSPDGRRIISVVAEMKSDVWLVENFDPSHRK
jgi:serine/threonine protein kinase